MKMEKLDNTASLEKWRKAKAVVDGLCDPRWSGDAICITVEQRAAIEAVARKMIGTIAPSVDFDVVLERVRQKVIVQGIYDLQCFAGEDDEINEGIVRGLP
jgi:hypothetical protein